MSGISWPNRAVDENGSFIQSTGSGEIEPSAMLSSVSHGSNSNAFRHLFLMSSVASFRFPFHRSIFKTQRQSIAEH